MNREDITRMVREAGLGGVENWEAVDALVQSAYAAGAAAERAECLELAKSYAHNNTDLHSAIRAREQA